VADARASLRRVLAVSVPSGWLPPVLPDDCRISVGAAIASDVHGRNHPGAGSFGHHVRWLDLRVRDGRVLRLSREQDPDAFWATIGGYGLTGEILRAELQLRRLTTARIRRTRIQTGSLADTLDVFGDLAAGQWHNPGLHITARIDPSATDQRLGRGLVETSGQPGPDDHEEIRAGRRRRWSGKGPGTEIVHVRDALFPAAARPSVRFDGGAGGSKRPVRRGGSSRLGSRLRFGGLVRYEFAVPENRAWLLSDVLRMLQRAESVPSRAEIKRFGAASPSPLSFPRPGWTMALDLPARRPGLVPALATADLMLARYGGRVLLASGVRLDLSPLASMYPRLDAWRAVCDRLDPQWGTSAPYAVS
jgi:decaprenylphospho-beta-D-ribofuranose 2-oxidase